MTNLKKLKPAGKNYVRNPDTMGHLNPAGELIEINAYWLRRVADGDVVEVKETPKAADEGKQ